VSDIKLFRIQNSEEQELEGKSVAVKKSLPECIDFVIEKITCDRVSIQFMKESIKELPGQLKDKRYRK